MLIAGLARFKSSDLNHDLYQYLNRFKSLNKNHDLNQNLINSKS